MTITFVNFARVEDNADWAKITKVWNEGGDSGAADPGCLSWTFNISEDKKTISNRDCYKDLAAVVHRMKATAHLVEILPELGITYEKAFAYCTKDVDLDELKKVLGAYADMTTFFVVEREE